MDASDGKVRIDLTCYSGNGHSSVDVLLAAVSDTTARAGAKCLLLQEHRAVWNSTAVGQSICTAYMLLFHVIGQSTWYTTSTSIAADVAFAVAVAVPADMHFDSPSAFSIYLKRLVNPARKADDGWKTVKYAGK